MRKFKFNLENISKKYVLEIKIKFKSLWYDELSECDSSKTKNDYFFQPFPGSLTRLISYVLNTST